MRHSAENGPAPSLPALRGAEAALAGLEALPDFGLYTLDRELRIVVATGGALGAEGWERGQLEGRLLADVIPPAAFELLEPRHQEALAGTSSTFEHLGVDDGRLYRVEVLPMREAGEIIGAMAVSRDITGANEALQRLRESNERFERAFEDAPIGMALISPDGRWLRVNRAICEITGYEESELLATTFQELTHPDDLDADLDLLRQVLNGEIRTYQTEKRYIRAKGDSVPVMLSVSLVRDPAGEPLHFVSQVEDISDRKRAERRLHHLADHDGLTGLWNRRRFEEAVTTMLSRSQRYEETSALLLLDLDGFKDVNDSHGHRAGDVVLREVAEALRSVLRPDDEAGRLGGDEFAVLAPGAGHERATHLTEQISEAIAHRLSRRGRISVRASIGVAIIDSGIGDSDDLWVAADRAMYAAKRAGGSHASFGRDAGS